MEVLTVGRELLIGRTLNTNLTWMGRRLALLGGMVAEAVTADDDLDEISRAVKESLGRHADFLVVAGGLGPTPDDMTLKGVSLGIGVKLRLERTALGMIRRRYKERGLGAIRMTLARKKMAMLPEGAGAVANGLGTAPGVRMKAGSTVIFCLPGVPSEMRAMFRRSVEPEVRGKIGERYRKAASFGLEGIFESDLSPIIARQLRRFPGTYIKSHPKGIREGVSRIEVDIVAVKAGRGEAEKACAGAARGLIRAIELAGGAVKWKRGWT